MVALRFAPPEPLPLAALDLLRERCELVSALALIRRGLLFKRAWASATLVWSVRVAGPLLGLWEGATRFGAPVLRLFAGAEVWAASARVFDAVRRTTGFLCLDACAPFKRLPLPCP